ncbi:MAG: hypothetical protein E7290_14370 [Lachnospiraceae bacterium]|nr:hypothetical protein [Lachnospiraceae bacterium]
MKRVRKVLALAMAFILTVSGLQMTGIDVNAKTQWKETAVTSVAYDVTVAGSGETSSFTWQATAASWSNVSNVVGLQGDGDYHFGLALNNETGMINLGYVETIADSGMTVTVNKITVNDTYELTYDSAPVLKAGSSWENGLVNIWSGLEGGAKICQNDKAYLAYDAASNLIKLYVAEEVADESTPEESSVVSSTEDDTSSVEPTTEAPESETPSVEPTGEEPTTEEPTTEVPSEEPTTEVPSTEEPSTEDSSADVEYVTEQITSVKYDVTVAGSGDTASFSFEAQGASWTTKSTTVALDGDGDYSFELAFDYEKGLKNLGFVSEIAGSEMTITVNKITVNEKYELTYEAAPVLQPGVAYMNGLSNIWGVQPQVVICKNDSAYLALDQADGAIQLYVAVEVEKPSTEDTEQETATVEAQLLSSISYYMTVDGADTDSITFNVQTASWTDKSQTVALNGDGEYVFDFAFDYETGLKNLGYIAEIAGSSMQVTVNKLVVNGEYELTYETAPVLQPGVAYMNGLSNIWGVQPQVRICGDDSAYLALDQADGAITFYAGSKASDDTDTDDKDGNTSIDYVKAMGSGWNLGNSFDGFDSNLNAEDKGELAWGNPTVVRELIAAVKDKGFDSIRMPMTLYRRYTVNENASADEYKYVIDEAWLARYKEVVNWAVEEDLYVMINIHHDSWIWLSAWDGDKESEEYRRFTELWEQLAAYMADLPEQVCFETINEPTFEDTGAMTAQKKLDEINLAAYHAIRNTKGNEDRMIVMPTLLTNHEKCVPLYNLIDSLDDENIIATVHYYSEWVYSANLGKTGFDEELWQNNGEPYTPRDGADYIMETINKELISKGIGVVIGEYGLLGYDKSEEGCMQKGEELKYYEYMGELARQYDVCLMFWDNLSGIDRRSGEYQWKQAKVGAMLEASMTGRSSYATGLDTLYFTTEVTEDVQIPLTLNGNTFTGIEGLTEGTDYTYDSASATVTLKKEYVNKMFAAMADYGTFATLTMKFSSGADWYEYLVKYTTPEIGNAEGTKEGIAIPVDFNGSKVRRVTAYQAAGRVGPNSDWWAYLQHDGTFSTDYEAGNISMLSSFFADSTVKNGLTKLRVEFYDGQVVYVWLNVADDKVTSSPDLAVNADDISASTTICLYAGETAIPAQYLDMPAGGSVYGTWVDNATNNGMVTLTGWPAKITFDTKAHDDFVLGGIVLYYMDVEKHVDVTFGIKDAPTVEDITVDAKNSQKLTVNNLAEDAKVSYKSSNEAVATVAEDGTVTGVKAGTTVITVTVEQYNRSDDFEATVTVTGDVEESSPTAKPTTTSSVSNAVVIEEEEAPLASSVTEVNGAVEVVLSPSEAVLKAAVLQKYYGRSMFVNAHLGNGIGFTVEADAVTGDLNIGMAKEVVANFAEGFHTLKLQPLAPGKLGMTVGMHVNVGTEYTGAHAYVFTWNAVTGLFEAKTVTTVNEIGNIGFYTDELTNVMILVEK